MVLAILITIKDGYKDPAITRFYNWQDLRDHMLTLTNQIDLKRMVNKATIEELSSLAEILGPNDVNHYLEILSDY